MLVLNHIYSVQYYFFPLKGCIKKSCIELLCPAYHNLIGLKVLLLLIELLHTVTYSRFSHNFVFHFVQHIAEIPYENQLIVQTKGIDHGTVTYLEKIDFLRSNLLAAHSVWLNEPEVRINFHNQLLSFK